METENVFSTIVKGKNQLFKIRILVIGDRSKLFCLKPSNAVYGARRVRDYLKEKGVF